MLFSVPNLRKYAYAGKSETNGSFNSFKDAAQVSSYTDDALKWCVEKSIFVGDNNGYLDPLSFAARAELGVIAQAFFEAVDRDI